VVAVVAAVAAAVVRSALEMLVAHAGREDFADVPIQIIGGD
jgi:hypothetical protein